MANNNSTEHPVWAVYDLLRTARLNVKYYSARIASLKRREFLLELVLAVSAPSSAISGLWLWDYEWGKLSWKILAIVAAVVAIIKPLLKLTEKMRKMEESLSGYRALDHDLYRLTLDINREKEFTPEIEQKFKEALARKGMLVCGELEHVEKKRLKRKCEREVMQELPPESFYIPEG